MPRQRCFILFIKLSNNNIVIIINIMIMDNTMIIINIMMPRLGGSL